MFRFSTPVPPRLSIEVQAGTVDVDTSTTDETTVELTPLNDSKSTTEAIEAATVEQHGDAIVVHVPQTVGSLIGRGPRVAVRVAAPDERRPARQDRLGGRHRPRHVRHDGDRHRQRRHRARRRRRLAARQHGQRRRAHRARRPGRRGEDRLGRRRCSAPSRGEVSFTSGSGDLELVAGGRALVAKTGSGNVTVGTAPADVRITTASGDTRIDTVEEGEIRVKAASGDVQAGGPRRHRGVARRPHRQRPGPQRARHG